MVGVDNLNDSYDVRLKHWRLKRLQAQSNFQFYHTDICDRPGLEQVFKNTTVWTA